MKSYIRFNTIILIFTLLLISCSENDEILMPSLTESATTSSITFTSIDISAELSLEGGDIIARGICWSVEPNPLTTDNKTVESTNQFTSSIAGLVSNTTYYFRVYVITNSETFYGQEYIYSTQSFDNTEWIFDTKYTGDFSIFSKIEFYDDGTTKFDELDLPGQAPGVFITYGTWSLDGNELTYIWEGNDINNSTYVYTGILNGMEMSGAYSHSSAPNGIWTAIKN